MICAMCVLLQEEESTRPSLAYKVLSAKHTKRIMSAEDVDDLARFAMLFTHTP